jgi:hypothetical protein
MKLSGGFLLFSHMKTLRKAHKIMFLFVFFALQTCLANARITEEMDRPDLANTWRLAGERETGR